MIRTERNYLLAAILLLSVILCSPAIATDESPVVSPAGSPLNSTLLDDTPGTWSQAPYHEPEPLITLLRLESAGTTFPGPRSMAFGPRRIEFSANPGALLFLAACASMAALALILYRHKKAAPDSGESLNGGPEDGR